MAVGFVHELGCCFELLPFHAAVGLPGAFLASAPTAGRFAEAARSAATPLTTALLTPHPRPPRSPQVLPIGGPSKAFTAKQQADLLFNITGLPPKYFPVPVALMDGMIGLFDSLAKLFPQVRGGGGDELPGSAGRSWSRGRRER